MSGPLFRLSYDCPDCAEQWAIDAKTRRDDACPCCGAVSLPTRARMLEAWPWPTNRAPQTPYPPQGGLL